MDKETKVGLILFAGVLGTPTIFVVGALFNTMWIGITASVLGVAYMGLMFGLGAYTYRPNYQHQS